MAFWGVGFLVLLFTLALPAIPSGLFDRLAAVVPPHPRPASRQAAAALSQALIQEDKAAKEQMNECLNDVLESRRDGQWSRTNGFLYELVHRVLLDDGSFFSFATDHEIFCGGAYVASGTTAVSMSVRDGGRYDILRLYRLAEDDRGSSGLVLRDAIRQMIRERLPQAFGSDNDDFKDCMDLIRGHGVTERYDADFVLAESGIMVFSQVPKAVSACFSPVMLPYATVRPFLDAAEAARLDWRR